MISGTVGEVGAVVWTGTISTMVGVVREGMAGVTGKERMELAVGLTRTTVRIERIATGPAPRSAVLLVTMGIEVHSGKR